MASRRLAALELSGKEGEELRSLAARRSTAQALALRAGSFWPDILASIERFCLYNAPAEA